MTTEASRSVRAERKHLRQQRDAWQRATVGLFALSMVGNMALAGMAFRADKRRWEETAAYEAQLAHANTVRDQAVRELGALANEIALDKLARQEQAEAYEAMGAYQYIGECTITAYCPCAECCGNWADGLTATGLPAVPGVVAVDPDVIPLGSTVIIDGQRYLAADTGSGVEGLHIDICMAGHEETAAFGVQTADVWVVNNNG